MRNKLFSSLALALLFVLAGCEPDYSPKPRGYYRIDFPPKKYQAYAGKCPFSFQYAEYSFLDTSSRHLNRPCWMNIHYPQYANTIHLSYFPIEADSLGKYIEDTRDLAMKHIVKANQIEENVIANHREKVYGITYDFSGETATNFQFFLTDSTNHFIRGAMYFNMPPQPDSLKPVAGFIKKDLYRFIKTFRWNE